MDTMMIFRAVHTPLFSDPKREDMVPAPPDPAVIGTLSDRGLRSLALPESRFQLL